MHTEKTQTPDLYAQQQLNFMESSNYMDIEDQQDDTDLLRSQSSPQIANEGLKSGDFTTPPKQAQNSNLNSNNFIQNSPSFLNQVQNQVNNWKDSLEKYKNDPEIAQVITQMNETLQNHSQHSGSKIFNITPKKPNLDEQSFSLGNNSFKCDNIFEKLTKLTENINIVCDELQNQSCQSPKTIDLSKLCNETCSEIKQQVNELERNFRYKDEELSCINLQLEKEFNICKNLKQVEITPTPSINQSLEISKRYQQLKDIRRGKLLAFKKKQSQNLYEIRKSFTEIKSFFKSDWPTRISKFQEELLSEASQQHSTQSEQQQEQIQLLEENVKQHLRTIDELNYQIQAKNDEIQEMEKLGEFFNELMIMLKINSDKCSDFESQKQQIKDQIKNFSDQILLIQQSQNLRFKQLTNQHDSQLQNVLLQKQMIELELQTIKRQFDEQNEENHNLQQVNNDLSQQLTTLNQNDFIAAGSQLTQVITQYIKQQQSLVLIATKIFQQFINSTSIQLDFIQLISDKTSQLDKYRITINETQLSNEYIKLNNHNKNVIDEVIQIICEQHKSVIGTIQEQRLEWIQSL